MTLRGVRVYKGIEKKYDVASRNNLKEKKGRLWSPTNILMATIYGHNGHNWGIRHIGGPLCTRYNEKVVSEVKQMLKTSIVV